MTPSMDNEGWSREWNLCLAAYQGDPDALLPWMMMVLNTSNYLVGLFKSRGVPNDLVSRGVGESITAAFLKSKRKIERQKTPEEAHKNRWFRRLAEKAAHHWIKKNQLLLPPPPPALKKISLTEDQRVERQRDAERVGKCFDLLFRGNEDGLFLNYTLVQGLGPVKAGESFGLSPEQSIERFRNPRRKTR